MPSDRGAYGPRRVLVVEHGTLAARVIEALRTMPDVEVVQADYTAPDIVLAQPVVTYGAIGLRLNGKMWAEANRHMKRAEKARARRRKR